MILLRSQSRIRLQSWLRLWVLGLVWGGFSQTSSAAFRVCIDPGHPSEVGRGTRGKTITEIKAVWLVAQKLETELASRGVEVVKTKSKMEQTVTNKRRAEIANESQVNLMIRLHCDAQSGSGFAVYFPDQQGKTQGTVGPSLEVRKQSGIAARAFHQVMKDRLQGILHDNGLMGDRKTAVGKKQGALTGSIFSKVPVVLVEMVRLTNGQNDRWIASEKGQNIMAKCLADATLVALKKMDKENSVRS